MYQLNNIHEYTSMLEDAQRKSQRGGMHTPDMQLICIATHNVLDTDQYPLTTLVWQGNLPAANTWALWKLTYTESDNQRDCQIQADGSGSPFGIGNTNGATCIPSAPMQPTNIHRQQFHLL